MKELNQQYIQVQYMPLSDLFKYAAIVEESMKELESNIEETKSKMNSGASRFRMRH